MIGFLRKMFGRSPPNDAGVLAQLARAGSDLSKPHPIDFYLYLPTGEPAQTAAAHLRRQGFDATVERAGRGPTWLCLAKKSMVPSLPAIKTARAELDGLARSLGGE